jgi:Uma2 family endonuclease
LVDGEVLVTPAPHWAHQRIVGRLFVLLEAYVRANALKRPRYQRNRVPEYWIVDDVSQTIERWTPDDERPELLAEQLVWNPHGASEPFVLDLERFFADVLPEDDSV